MRNFPLFSSKFFACSLITLAIVIGHDTASAQGRPQFRRTQAQLSASSTTLSFSNVQDGGSKKIAETLTNTGRTSVTISSAKVSGTDFSISSLTLPATLAAGHSYTFQVTFSPKASGSSKGSIAIANTAAAISISLSGTGTSAGTLAVTPGTMNFGSLAVGASKSATGTLTASGTSVVVASAGTSSAEYAMSGITLPLTIAAGKTASFTLTFKPQSSGAVAATASFKSNASDASLAEALSGTGTSSGGTGSTPVHNVSLTWKASTSSVAGYNIYRGSKSGGPYAKLNSSPDTATVYTDGSVTGGSTYYYVTKALSSAGTESSASNEAKAVVPTP
jgi:hypothetical protein